MAENFYSILTAVGLAKIANAQVSGNKVNLTQIAVGDGGGTYYNPTQNDTHLKNEVWRGNIGSVEIDPENPNWIVIESYIPSTVGGFTVREVGIFDAEGDMIAIGKYPETFKPSLEEGASKDLLLRMIIEVTNASAVTMKVDPSVIIASRKYVDEKVGVVSNNLMQLQQEFMSYSAQTEDELSAIESRKMDKDTNDISIYQINKNKGLIDESFISDSLKQQIVGNTPIHSTPAKGSITKDKLTKRLISQEQTTFLQKGKNLFDKDNVLRGYFINQSGDLIENTSYSVTDFIGIKPDTNYFRSASSTIAFYDGSFNFISREYETNGIIKSPENAAYARIALSNGYIPLFQFEEGDAPTPREDFYLIFDSLKLTEQNFQNKIIPLESLKNLRRGKNLFNKNDIVKGSISMSTGILDGGLSGFASNYIEIEPNTNYSKNIHANFAFYDKDKKFIEGQFDSTMTTFTSPNNAKYIRISNSNNSNLDKLQLEKGDVVTAYEPFGYRLGEFLYENDIKKLNNPIKYPISKVVNPTTYLPGGSTHVFGDIDKYGNIWAVAWQDLIRKSSDGIKFTTVIDAKPFLDKTNGETISQYALMITDTGRIVCGTSKGRVLVSDEEQTTLTEAFVFENGYTQNTWGYDKKGRYILMATYVQSKGANSQGREVYLSKDFGATWDRIFYKDTATMVDSTNYHIHDVAFDQYSDCILISIGDGANRNILYSYDYGETWKEMFDESIYNENNWAPIHPTSIIIFPDGYAFGSDELPEGITWWNRPKGIEKPEIKWEDCEYKITFNEDKTVIGTFAQKGDMIQTTSGIYGIMPFRNHNTQTEGHARLFATGDGGKTWHEVFKDDVWNSNRRGFWNARLREEGDGIYIYSSYSQDGLVYIWRAKLPYFITFQ